MIRLAELLQGKRLLLFDFDGTVADTTPFHARAFKEVLEPLGVRVDYLSIAGLKTNDAIKACLKAAGRTELESDLPVLAAEKQRLARQFISNELHPIPEVENFLLWARTRFQLALVTSGSRLTVHLALEKLDYTNWFNPVVCAEDVIRAKPAPDGFLKALRATHFGASEAIVFEDSASGFQAANAAGLPYIDVTTLNWALEIEHLRG